MKNRLLPAVMIAISVLAVIAVAILGRIAPPTVDTLTLNDLRAAAEAAQAAGGDYAGFDDRGLRVAVIDGSGAVLYESEPNSAKSYDEWINFAYQNDCFLVDFSAGKILVFKPRGSAPIAAAIAVSAVSAALVLLLLGYWLYLRKAVFVPFRRLQKFAGAVAAGNLDDPLLMDRRNAFGAFTESFDILREELKKSREKAVRLEKSKKELVAGLSHDIKTPVASIKAVAELLSALEKDAKTLAHLAVIRQKATEIDTLITDMFHSALEELSELKIETAAVGSDAIEQTIKEADYFKRINDFKLPECLALTDPVRFSQVAGNIINNSYKYANTPISVVSDMRDGMLTIEFRDYGGGVAEEELPLLAQKFYRGENKAGKSGAGLGLYLTKTILEQSGGGMECYNTQDGFAVKIYLKLA